MKKQYAVIGLGRFGYSVAKTLTELGCEVLAIDNDDEKVKTVSDIIQKNDLLVLVGSNENLDRLSGL